MKDLESITDFCERASAAGLHDLCVKIGRDEQSGLIVLRVSPQIPQGMDVGRAKEAGFATRTFYAEGDLLLPADGQVTFAQSVMRSGMTDAQKVDWLYETLREYEDRLLAEGGEK